MGKKEKKELVEEIKVDGFNQSVQVFFVNNSYYSIVYKEKEEYYTTDKKVAFLVGKIILNYFKTLDKSLTIFKNAQSEEEKWKQFIEFLRQESQISKVDWEICLGVYRSLEASHDDMDTIEDKSILSKRNSIRTKDNLVKTINKVVYPLSQGEAKRNVSIYKGLRNGYIKNNPELNLELL